MLSFPHRSHGVDGSAYEGAECETFDRDEDGLERPFWTDPLTLGAREADTGGNAERDTIGLCGDATVGESVNGRPATTGGARSLVPGVHKCGTCSDSVARRLLVVDGSGLVPV